MDSPASVLRTPPLQVGEFPWMIRESDVQRLRILLGRLHMKAGEQSQLSHGHLTTVSNQPQLLNPVAYCILGDCPGIGREERKP